MNKKIIHQQRVTLDEAGAMLQCQGNVFNCEKLSDQSVVTAFPFVESIFPSLLELSMDAFPVVYPVVHGNHPLLPGYYEFRFERPSSMTIRWLITEVNQKYEAMQRQRKPNS